MDNEPKRIEKNIGATVRANGVAPYQQVDPLHTKITNGGKT
jgi:hypothetical protein